MFFDCFEDRRDKRPYPELKPVIKEEEIGRFFIGRFEKLAAEIGVHRCAAVMKKQAVPLEVALKILTRRKP